MASLVKRGSISVRGATYAALRTYAAEKGQSISDVVEQQLDLVLAEVRRRTPAVPVRVVVAQAAPAPSPARPPTLPQAKPKRPPQGFEHRPIDLRRNEGFQGVFPRAYKSTAENVYGPVRLDSAPGMGVKAEPRPAPTPAKVPRRVGGPALW
jgi:hypothetical protein